MTPEEEKAIRDKAEAKILARKQEEADARRDHFAFIRPMGTK